MLPSSLCDALKNRSWSQGTHHDRVIMLSLEVLGYRSMCERLQPDVVLNLINELFIMFDSLVSATHGISKIDSKGGTFFAFDGVEFSSPATRKADDRRAMKVLILAFSMLECAKVRRSPEP
jgi:hypothetical protein